MKFAYADPPYFGCGASRPPTKITGSRDWMACAVTRQRGLKGAKPEQFNQWVLDLLAFDPTEDTIDDLFPGTAGMERALASPPLDFGGPACAHCGQSAAYCEASPRGCCRNCDREVLHA